MSKDKIIIGEYVKEEILKKRQEYYSKIFVLLEIVKNLKNKELSFICKDDKKKTMRYFVAFTINYLQKYFKAMNFFKYNINLYHSVTYLRDIPIFTLNFKLRKKEQKYIDFNENYDYHVSGIDLFLDFDGKEDFTTCYKETKDMKTILEEMKVPYYILNSSSNGFHIIIPNEYIPPLSSETIKHCNFIGYIIDNIKLTHDFETLDDSVTDIKRLKKLPYSFVSDGSIALPLSDYNFRIFENHKCNYEWVMKNIRIKERGLLIRDYGLNLEQLKQNTNSFIQNYL